MSDLVEDWGAHRRIPGVQLRVVQHDELVFEGASGHTTRWGSRRLRPSDQFHVASIGKLFTATAALRLWERNLLDLDAPVSELIGRDLVTGLVVAGDADYWRGITARRLLSHTAGLGNSDRHLRFQLDIAARPRQRRSPEMLIARARRIEPAGRPGERQSYSSPGYFLLGRILEAATELPYHQVVRKEVLEPIGMTATQESTNEWTRGTGELHHYVGPYDLWNAHPSFEFADGGFVTTAEDLCRFGVAMMSGEAFTRPTTLAEMCRKQPTSVPVADSSYIGLGVNVAIDRRGRHRLYHRGFWGTGLVMFPEAGLVLTYSLGQSSSAFGAFEAAAVELAWSQAGQ